jgi:tetratricopeptide (TPR) repeat protein
MTIGCKQGVNFKDVLISKAYDKALADKTDENVKQFVSSIDKACGDAKDKASRVEILHNAVEACKQLGLEREESIYIFALLNEDFDSPKTPAILYSYAEKLRMAGKILPSEIMYLGIEENFPNSAEAKNGKKYVMKNKEELRTILLDQSKKIFSSGGQLDDFKAKDFINNAESFAVAMPKDTASGSFLFMAAEVARASASWTKALSLYTNLVQAPVSLFIKGFLLETQLKDSESAVKIFKQFLAQYPTHQFADDAKFLIENAGKDESELLKAAQGK